MARAMKPTVISTLQGRSKQFCWRFIQLQPMHMTHDECLHLLAPTYHHELLKTAASVAEIERNGSNYMTVEIPYKLDGIDHPKIDLTMRTHEGQEPPLRPRAAKWQGQCPLAIQRKVTDWAEHYLRHTRMCATVNWVVEKLGEMCETGHQVRYLWPAVLHLAAKSDSEDTKKWVDKYGIRVVPRAMPQITPAFRRILTETSEWLAQGVLLEEVKPMEYHQVYPSRDSVYSFTLELEGTEVVLARSDP